VSFVGRKVVRTGDGALEDFFPLIIFIVFFLLSGKVLLETPAGAIIEGTFDGTLVGTGVGAPVILAMEDIGRFSEVRVGNILGKEAGLWNGPTLGTAAAAVGLWLKTVGATGARGLRSAHLGATGLRLEAAWWDTVWALGR
jgi:hypothetical protein